MTYLLNLYGLTERYDQLSERQRRAVGVVGRVALFAGLWGALITVTLLEGQQRWVLIPARGATVVGLLWGWATTRLELNRSIETSDLPKNEDAPQPASAARTGAVPRRAELSDDRIALVFQGGGAKGVVYSGVLRAVEEHNLAVRYVAGASAGALTAALVASGLNSHEIRKKMPSGLKALSKFLPSEGRRRSGLRNLIDGLQRHREQSAVFPTDEFEEWLVLALSENGSTRPTFMELFKRTGIELHVVAANVTRGSLAVFNHEQTPDADVALAVLASSAIPGLFRPGYLVHGRLDGVDDMRSAIEDSDEPLDELRRETLADGGVWSNYPDFVFRDPSFRQWAGLPRLEAEVIGIILDDGSSRRPGSYDRDAQLLDPEIAIKVKRVESRSGRTTPRLVHQRFVAYAFFFNFALLIGVSNQTQLARAVALGGLVPVAMARIGLSVYRRPRSITWDDPPWHIPSNWRAGTWLGLLADSIMRGLYVSRFGLVFAAVPIVGGLTISAAILSLALFPEIEGPLESVLWSAWANSLIIVSSFVILVSVPAAVLLALVRYLAPSILSSGPGAGRTLLAASTNVRPWAGASTAELVVRVPVPPFLSTLSFDLAESELETAHTVGYDATVEWLPE